MPVRFDWTARTNFLLPGLIGIDVAGRTGADRTAFGFNAGIELHTAFPIALAPSLAWISNEVPSFARIDILGIEHLLTVATGAGKTDLWAAERAGSYWSRDLRSVAGLLTISAEGDLPASISLLATI